MRSLALRNAVSLAISLLALTLNCGGTCTAAGVKSVRDAVGTAEHKQSRSISARDLLSLRDVGGEQGSIALSPNGQFVAFQLQEADFASRNYRLTWFVVPVSGGKPIMVGDGGELMLNASTFGRISGARADVKAEWSPDGRWIAYLRKDAGQVQLWRSSVDGSVQEQLTKNAADVTRFAWREDGAAIYFQVGRDRLLMREMDREESDRGFLLDARFSPDYSVEPLWYPCGEQIWGTPAPASQQCASSTWMLELGGFERKAGPEEEKAFGNRMDPPKIDSDANRKRYGVVWNAARVHLAWLEDEGPGTGWAAAASSLVLYADNRRCNAPECYGRLKEVWWNGDEVIFLRHEGHAYSFAALYAWKLGEHRAKRLYRIDGVLRSCAPSNGQLICLQETPNTPRNITAIQLTDGTHRTVFDPNPNFNDFELGAVERLEWTDGFGNETFGHLVYPPERRRGERYPLVVVQYRSRGFLRGGVGNEYPIFPLAAKGFAVLSYDEPVDWKVITQFKGDTPQNVGASSAKEYVDSYKDRRAVTGLDVILDRLERLGIVDAARVGITGLSSGADTVDFAIFNSDRFAAAAQSGDWTPQFYMLTVNDTFREFQRALFASKSGREMFERWRPQSIAYNADKVYTPLLIQVSDHELISNVPIFVALKDAGKPVEAYVFPNEYHVKWQPQHKLAVAERSIDWFQFWLEGQEDHNPSKSEQYRRWRALRDSLRRRTDAAPATGDR